MSYLSKATKASVGPPVITIIGFPGVGKSSLAATFPNPIFIQAEKATTVFEGLPEEDQPTFLSILPRPSKEKNIKTSEVMLEQLRELALAEHDFKTVVIDTTTSLNTLFEEEVVAFDPNGVDNIAEARGGFNKGYGATASIHSRIRKACEALRDRRGMTIIYLAHTGIAKMKNRPDVGDYTAFTIAMNNESRTNYIDHADAVVYLKAKEFVKGTQEDKKGRTTKFGQIISTGERYLITSSDGTVGYIDAKNRYNMPQELECPDGDNPMLEYIPYLRGGK